MTFPAKVFIDTNIVLDLLTARDPFFADAQKLFTLADKGLFELFISADSLTTIAYFLNKQYGKQEPIRHLIQFKTLVKILPVNEKVIDLALASKAGDFEDGVQMAVAETNGMSCIVTRDIIDFVHTDLAVFTTSLFLKAFSQDK